MLWVAKVLLFLEMNARRDCNPANTALSKFIECSEPLNGGGNALVFTCIGWSTDSEVPHTLHARADSRTARHPRVGHWFQVRPIESIKGTVSVTCSRPGFKLFTNGLHWPQQRIYVETFKKSSSNAPIWK